ncbi:uncharacterized protein B0T15DRAFT_482623 [Chaetomium strumarium]|uniref:DUF6604 domain-containing protein n=1 Tax=Chaetomium strumarium TaxID=1170767 RepID=A0AAJ0H4G3_9PEZI|nr:hypothetical protein B0T15DRAFT_482623 [Chaetomium strumarium]
MLPPSIGRLKGKARKGARQNPEAQSAAAPKYTVAIKDFIPLAEWIASRQPAVAVPAAFASVNDRVIKVRSRFADDITSHGPEVDDESNERHSYFLGVLEKVREVLKPRMPAGVADPPFRQQPDEPERLANMFAALEGYEPAEFADSSSISLERPATEKAEDDVVYEAEQQTSLLDARIRWIWTNYQTGVIDVAVAAIATNAAVDLARDLIEEVLPVFRSHGVWTIAQRFYFACCMARGFDIEHVQDANGHPNPNTYDVQGDVSMVAYNVLLSVVRILGPNLPLYKDGIHWTEKFQEDRIPLYEMFSELITVARVQDYPIQDEFLRGIKGMDQTREVPFHLVFAAQVHLDIHHILRADVARAFHQMMEQITLMRDSLREQADFHKCLKFENWTPADDRVLQQGQAEDLRKLKHRHRILRSSSVLAGLMLFHFRTWLFDIGIAIANAFGSVSYAWHLYNAARREKLLPKQWDDMEIVYALLGLSSFHVGDASKDTHEYLKRFCLQMGVSVTAFVGQKQPGRKSKVASRAGPRGIKEGARVNRTFKSRYVENSARFNWTPEDLDQVISTGKWQPEESTEEGTFSMVQSDEGGKKGPRGKLPHAGRKLRAESVIESLVLTLQAETLEFSFPYLAFHRKCWQLLRDVRKRCDPLLRQKYTPAYMERETELPWVVGYIFWAAAGSVEGSTQVIDLRLLEAAAKRYEILKKPTYS